MGDMKNQKQTQKSLTGAEVETLFEWIQEHRSCLAKCSLTDRSIWQEFRRTHDLFEAQEILEVLAMRDFSISQFVRAWAFHRNACLAVHQLWRSTLEPMNN